MTLINAPVPPIPIQSPPVKGPVRSLTQLVQAFESQQLRPIVNLSEALLLLRILDQGTVDGLLAEDPELLRARSHELVTRLVLTHDELQRALAREAGVVEVEALGFELERDAFDILPLPEARAYTVLPLGQSRSH